MSAVRLQRTLENFAACLAGGQVLRIGESSLLGQAKIVPDARHLDVVYASAADLPLTLWICHYPGKIEFAGVREALLAGFAAFCAQEGASETAAFPVVWAEALSAGCAAGASVRLDDAGHAIRCELVLPGEWLELPFYLVAAVE